MSNETKEEVEPQEATITFEIPAYVDKNTGQSFKRVVKCPTKKAYAIYLKTIRPYQKPETEGTKG